MSAYFVEPHLVDYLLTFASQRQGTNSVYVPSCNVRLPLDHQLYSAATRQTNLDRIGEILLAENLRSLETRYPSGHAELHGDYNPASYRFREHPEANRHNREAVIGQVLKACAFYDYQSCEAADYEQTDAAHIIREIRGQAIAQLPAYGAASWGAPDHPAPTASGAPGGPVSLMSIMAGRV